MEVILIQDLANLGFKNDIVKVRDGYGRNYLLPQKIAIIASLRTSSNRLTKPLNCWLTLRLSRQNSQRP